MPFDLSQPSKLPLSFDAHVIVNTDTGDTHEVAEHFASLAMMKFFKDEKGWGKFFETEERRREQIEFIAKMAEARDAPPDFPNDLIKVGPFVTWDQCSHVKSQELMAQCFERFCQLGGDLVRPIDHKVLGQIRGEMAENYGIGEVPDGMTVEPVHMAKKIHKVGDMPSRRGPPGMPPELAALFGRMGVKFKEIGEGSFMGTMDLDDLRKAMKDDDKDDKKD